MSVDIFLGGGSTIRARHCACRQPSIRSRLPERRALGIVPGIPRAWPSRCAIAQRVDRWSTPRICRFCGHNRGSTGRADLSTNVRTDYGASRGLGWGAPPLSFLAGLPLADGLRVVVVPSDICTEHVQEDVGFCLRTRRGRSGISMISYASEIRERPGLREGNCKYTPSATQKEISGGLGPLS
jgi:hypothetical protein